MAKESIVGPDGGDVIRLGPATVRIIEDGSTTGHRLGIGEITVAPRSAGPPQHRHARHDEGFYVVSGTARFTIGASSYDAAAGTLAMIPPGTPHTFANPGDEPLVMVNTFTPDLYVQYFRDLRESAAGGSAPTPQATARVMSRYATEVANDYAPSKESPMTSRTYTVSTPAGDVPVLVTESGSGGRPVLLLHGGAGPDSVTGFGDALAARFPFRVLSPVYPGFSGTARPEWLDSMGTLAQLLSGLLAELDVTDVIVAGSSIGGWAAAEVALAAPSRVGQLVLMDPAGLDSADHPIADFFSLTPDQVAELSWANPEGHRIDPAALPEAQRAILLGNREALVAYGGRAMGDPTLAGRLGGITAPTLVIWGEADRIVTPGYGKEYAAAIPGAVFREVPAAGHLPQLENPEAVLALFGELAG